ncbi:aldo/keto reductase family protein [Desulfococcus sp.]|uniref:aldo/keto reductase family protein n=1 Tax=Desulfococcus sp. TaxID=2025834 RepID=UPI0035942203
MAHIPRPAPRDYPMFIYGTAWKEDSTETLVRTALDAGFRGIDTANQRRHYVEAAVGDAVAAAIEDGLIRREELFLQTKFTYAESQDDRIPYDPRADPADQVRQSFQSSLAHLRTDYLDAYLLHGPSVRRGLTERDRAVWKAMEGIHATDGALRLGVSNVALDQLEALVDGAGVKPAVVQNRCFAQMAWDRPIRDFCRTHQIIYQGFSLLTANAFILSHPGITRIAARVGKTPAQVVFRFAIQAGILPLTGTTSGVHMRQDLDSADFAITDDEAAFIEEIAIRPS